MHLQLHFAIYSRNVSPRTRHAVLGSHLLTETHTVRTAFVLARGLSDTPPETKHAACLRAPCEPTHVKCRENRFAHPASATEEWQKTELLLDSFSGHARCACAAYLFRQYS